MTPTEHCRVELKIPNDLRALGAVHGALQHTARHLGLPSNEEEQIIAVIDRLLRSTYSAPSKPQELAVMIQEFPDRFEIEIACSGAAPALWESTRQLPGIDKVEQEADGGQSRLKLVKRLSSGAKTPSPAD
jgi:hypothetical protein